jgi:cardiolipin synthase/putative cardiolipin synthase
MLNAENVVRVANPYFDPGHPTVETLRTLPRRGIETRILTRAIDPGTDRYEVLKTMGRELSHDERGLVSVAEMSTVDEDGRQAFATHAKLVVVDEKYFYVGSANFTVTNLTTNFEFGILASGPDVPRTATVFDEVFEAGRSIPFPLRT